MLQYFLFLWGWLWTSPAHALGDDVLLYTGNGGFSYLSSYPTTTFNSVVTAEGCAVNVTEDSSGFPTDLSSYRLVFLMLNTSAFSTAEIARMQSFTAGGGVLVLVGETTGYTTAHIPVFNSVLSGLSKGTTFKTSASLDSSCRSDSSIATSHALNSGAPTPAFAWSGDLTLGTRATKLYSGPSGQSLAAVEGNVVMLTDMNLLVEDCPLNASNEQFFLNLYAYADSRDACDLDDDGVDDSACGGTDCDDCDASVVSTTRWYRDADSDTYGIASTSTTACTQPSGYVSNDDDCNDGSAAIRPSATETCDSVDNDCDGSVDESGATGSTNWYRDADSDGYGNPSLSTSSCSAPSGYVSNASDCNDGSSAIKPGAAEVCDSADNDCDGSVDETGSVGSTTWYRDADSDAYGNPSVTSLACSRPSGYVSNNTDCNDANAAVKPGATETCDSIDNDCDSSVDEAGATGSATWYRDVDSDTYGNASLSTSSCSAPSGYVGNDDDCNDSNAAIKPSASEVCDSADNDCDGTIDESSAVGAPTWYRDADSDTYGNASVSAPSCTIPSGYVSNASDCNDASSAAYPGAAEICDSIDNDCDSTIDEAGATGSTSWYRDADSDTYGNASLSTFTCTQPGGYVSNDDDCNDATSAANPAAAEVCDAIDNDCDGTSDEDSATDAATWYRDADSDAYGNASLTDINCTQPSGYVGNDDDCNDSNAAIKPGASEVCDAADNDCDGTIDESSAIDAATWYRDADSDTYGNASLSTPSCTMPSGYVSDDDDCNDGSAAVNPGAAEVCDSTDNDCDGTSDEDSAVGAPTWYRDADSDTYGNASLTDVSCAQPSGYVGNDDDCDDADGAISPAASEVCDTIDNDCDGTSDEDSAIDAATWYRDADSDTYGTSSLSDVSCTQPSGYVDNDEDCDDADGAISPAASEVCDTIDNDCDGSSDESSAVDASTWYRDADSDTYGDAAVTTPACTLPAGYSADDTDCDDSDASVYPGAWESSADDLDSDCDGQDDVDADADGFPREDTGGNDCDDGNVDVYPGAVELADGIDNDCDGSVDESTDHFDADGDGYAPAGGDCDDTDADVSPGSPEVIDGLDNDCDGRVDDGTEAYDDDGDGVSEVDGDCDDADASTGPGTGEVSGNGIDDDCDGTVDSGLFDEDGDGFLAEGGDCDDTDADIHPGAAERADGLDDDCDGTVDEGTEAYDDDGDGFSEVGGDCDDANALRSPNVAEALDGLDNNCDSIVDEGTEVYDDDGDGFSERDGDCDDADAATAPGAEEVSDGLDNDCDALIDEVSDGEDADWDGYTSAEGDCDDGDAWSSPDAAEVCDGADNDCDGDIDEEDVCVAGEVPVEEDDEDEGKGGCATVSGGGGGLLWLAGLLGATLRHRRRSGLAAAVLSGCGVSVENNLTSIEPVLSADPVADLGLVAVDTPHTMSLALRSVGTGRVEIEALTLEAEAGSEGAFVLVTEAVSELEPGSEGEVQVRYQATSSGRHRAWLWVESNDDVPALIELRAESTEPMVGLWPPRLDFGPVTAGQDLGREVYLTNDGRLTLAVEQIEVGAPFSVQGAEDQEPLVPGEVRRLVVTFAPDTGEAAADTLEIRLGDGGTLQAELLGNDCESGTPAAYDLDGDGFTSCGGDCDDGDASVRPGAVELADGRNQDCDALTDEGTEVYDDDGDGFAEDGGDCDDTSGSTGPEAEERGDNGIDDDCDGLVDDGRPDEDGDGYAVAGGDCDDTRASLRPGAAEIADGLDQDCDGTADEGTEAYDDDGDGVSERGGDCDDSEATTEPGAGEVADWVDNDCDGAIDEGTAQADDDGDGYTEDGGDCDDTDGEVHPAARESSGDGVDNDCDGRSE